MDQVGLALEKVAAADPTFVVRASDESVQTVISGMCELHVEIIIDRLKREFNVEANQGQPQVAYKETISNAVTHRETYKKQSGGRGKFADIQVEIGPADEGKEGVEVVNQIVGGAIPREYIDAVEKGLRDAMKNGALAGYEVRNLKVRI